MTSIVNTENSSNIDFENYTDVCYDSRAVKEGSIFVCIKGEATDGHKYIEKALEAGAKLLVVQEKALEGSKLDSLKEKVSVLEVEDTRLALAEISSQFYSVPSKDLRIIGVTGTNGKTTVSHLIQGILSSREICASLGTIGYKETFESEYLALGNTTPQSTELQRLFSESLKKGAKSLTMEVSSHALDQHRVSGINFKGSVFTNLTQDHLDYHKTMERYFLAKAELINKTEEYLILNADDSYYEKYRAYAEEVNSKRENKFKIISYGVNADADLRAVDHEFFDDGINYVLKSKDPDSFPVEIWLNLNGMFNIYNSLAAIAVALEEGVGINEIKAALEKVPPVAGRFEVLKNEKSPMCIVDYAHTPDGLDNILKGAKELKRSGSQLICLFGCGGDRDMTKRPKMAKIAFENSDLIYVTSDNPRTEDPEQIIADILTGIPSMDKVKVVPDRAQAIKEAVKNAKPEDIVVVAGKGHEDYQILGDKTIHFDDKEEVEKVISSL